jgi:V8-like Glu-specific endopeptidase
MGRLGRAITGLALACAALATQAAPAGAAVPQTPEAIRDFWTPERMREAKPAEQLLPGRADIIGADEAAAAKRGGSNGAPVRHRRRYPKRTHGKVYFTIQGSGNFVCSGTVVNAPSDRLVLTAGHCTYECVPVLLDCDPTRATNFNFVPAYKNGKKPFGEWPAKAGGVRATPQYENNENLAYDVGAAVIAPRKGRKIENVLRGGRRIDFNPDWSQRYRLFGYPIQGEYSGSQSPFMCRVHASGRDNNFNPPPTRVPCDMTGGASGGGWITNAGRLASVTSYSYGVGNLHGPYFGSAIKNFYDDVKSD